MPESIGYLIGSAIGSMQSKLISNETKIRKTNTVSIILISSVLVLCFETRKQRKRIAALEMKIKELDAANGG